MNVRSQASVTYAYALGNLKIKNITHSNVVSTIVREVGLLAKKIANVEFFKPGDVITYNIIVTNPGNTKATKVTITDELDHQSYVKDSFRYLFLDDSEAEIKLGLKEGALVFEIGGNLPGFAEFHLHQEPGGQTLHHRPVRDQTKVREN